MLCCSTVCGLWSSWLSKGHLLLFSPNVSPHIFCPQHVSVSRVGPLVLRNQTAVSFPGPYACSFISSASVSDWMGALGAGVFLISLTLSCPPTVCLLTWPRVILGPGPRAPVCVCILFAPPFPVAVCYRWDLRLSVSACAARRRRKQDARGSTVIS